MQRASTVNIDADFLRRVYTGEDPQGFAQFVGEAAASPNFLVMAFQPASLGVIELRGRTHGLGKVAYGHCVLGTWKIFKMGLEAARLAGCRHFLYPVGHRQQNRAQIEHLLTGRYGFTPYEHIFIRRIDEHPQQCDGSLD